jgi:hypothetical protein
MKHFIDGDQLCITFDTFVNLQESLAVFYPLDGEIARTVLGHGSVKYLPVGDLIAVRERLDSEAVAMMEKKGKTRNVAKHVPGPYKATRAKHEGKDQKYWWIDSGHDYEPHGNLATVWSALGLTPEQTEATAQLFAESPVLFEALEWLLHLHHGVSRGGCDPETGEPYPVTSDEWNDALEFAKEAIAKVKGERE